jgi:hypothetical protein
VVDGVEPALLTPTRDFRAEERGVMLLSRKGFTGVVSSCAIVLGGRGVVLTLLRTVRLDSVLLAEVASRGVRGVFAVRVLASVGFKGLPLFVFRRSVGIVRGWSRRRSSVFARGRCATWAVLVYKVMGCKQTGAMQSYKRLVDVADHRHRVNSMAR